nr:SGNH/GDSL hydrolase family protein [uncultured Desulfobacter sp.]
MKLRGIIVLLLISVFSTNPIWASQFSGMYVFGDSLSDQGNIFAATSSNSNGPTPPLEYTDGINVGRFTNGLNYIDYLSDNLGLSSRPYLAGGTNFSFGGARISSHPYGGYSLLQQLDLFAGASGGMADPNALYVVWAGANDLADYLRSSGTMLSPTESVTYLLSVIQDLAGFGAKNILVSNIPDLGLTPMIMALGSEVTEMASALTTGFNENLEAGLGSLESTYADVNFIWFDTFGAFNEIVADPVAAGFSNATEACYSEFVMPDGTVIGDPDKYLSWDGFHPTSAVHQILADQMAGTVVPVPSTVFLLVSGLVSLAGIYRRKKQA